MSYVLGIDIGETATIAAISRLDARGWSAPEVVGLGPRSPAVPSVLHVAADGSFAVGDPMQVDPVRVDPRYVARGFNRRIGDDVPVLVGGEPCPAETLTAVLATWVVEQVAAWERAAAEQVVISHPAAWGPHRRSRLRQALAETGLARVRLVPEPVLAAESYAAGGGTGGTLAVYSLGGNHAETSVVRWAEGFGFRLLGRAALADPLGGVDIDEALTEHVQALLGKEFRAVRDGAHGRLALLGLRRECVRAKERLSAAGDTEVRVPLPHGQVSVPVARATLEELARPVLRVTVETLLQTVASCGLAGHQLDGVLLVGGATRMPLVAELVGAALPAPVAAEPDPRTVAATGAAVAAARVAISPRAPQRSPIWTAETSGLRPLDPSLEAEPGVAPEVERVAGPPPPRPPVSVAPLQLSGTRRFRLVGGRS